MADQSDEFVGAGFIVASVASTIGVSFCCAAHPGHRRNGKRAETASN
jgi:hypothetical protein